MADIDGAANTKSLKLFFCTKCYAWATETFKGLGGDCNKMQVNARSRILNARYPHAGTSLKDCTLGVSRGPSQDQARWLAQRLGVAVAPEPSSSSLAAASATAAPEAQDPHAITAQSMPALSAEQVLGAYGVPAGGVPLLVARAKERARDERTERRASAQEEEG